MSRGTEAAVAFISDIVTNVAQIKWIFSRYFRLRSTQSVTANELMTCSILA